MTSVYYYFKKYLFPTTLPHWNEFYLNSGNIFTFGLTSGGDGFTWKLRSGAPRAVAWPSQGMRGDDRPAGVARRLSPSTGPSAQRTAFELCL